MTRKRLISKFAREIRNNTNRSFIESIALSKAFYKYKTSVEDGVLGFSYEYSNESSKLGHSYEECLFFDGKIETKDGINSWEIPYDFYVIRNTYFN